MIINNTDFGPVWGASGVQNFFGEGYPFHKYLKLIPGFNFRGMTFVAKTATAFERVGNMPLSLDTLQPKEFIPVCIRVLPHKGVVLNAVGLSGPGITPLLQRNLWQKRRDPFMISFMEVGDNGEVDHFVNQMNLVLSKNGLKAYVAVQYNLSCPNTSHDLNGLIAKSGATIRNMREELGIPFIPKFLVTTDPVVAAEIVDKAGLTSICVSNTVPWGMFPDRIDWEGLFGTDISPLAHLGGGGLSGKPLLPLVVDWVREFKRLSGGTMVNAGGGILRAKDVNLLASVGADSISIGSLALLRPWRVRSVIKRAYRLLGS